MGLSFEHAAAAIVDAGRRLDARGWAMGGSGNYSVRLEDGTFAVTVSGRHKGHLQMADIMRVDAAGHSLDDRRPSAETLAHTSIYRARPLANAVLHTHSVPAVVLTRLNRNSENIILAGYEMLKAIPGLDSHDAEAALPVIGNDQDMSRLAAEADRILLRTPAAPAFLIREHGLYAWGASMEQAIGAIEGIECMLACELELRRVQAGDGA